MVMQSITDMLLRSLEDHPPGQLHARAAVWLHHMGASMPLPLWLESSSKVGQAALLCAAARIRQDAAYLDQAAELTEAEWLSPELGWAALGAARLALGDADGAQAALTHPDCPPDALTLPTISWLLQARLLAGQPTAPVLDHLGPGHDAIAIILALCRRAPDLAATALALLPRAQRDEAVVCYLLTGAVPETLPAVSPAVEATWLARSGRSDLARSRLAPALIDRLSTWSGSAPPQATALYHHLALACAALADIEGALWCLERLAGVRPRLRGVWRVSLFCPDPRLRDWALGQGVTPEDRAEAYRQAGRIAARLDQPLQARADLHDAALLATELASFYPRRLALQAISHAQIEIGYPLDAVHTITRLEHPRFGNEQRTAAAVRLLQSEENDEAMKIMKTFPAGYRRSESCCAALAAMLPAVLGPGV